MLLKISYDEETYLTLTESTHEEFEENGGNTEIFFTQDSIYKAFFNIIFRVKDKIISFKDKKTGYIYTNNESHNTWNINSFDKKTFEIKVIGTLDRKKEEVFITEYKDNGFTKKLCDLKSKDILNNLKGYIKKYYKDTMYNEIYTILFFANRYTREIYKSTDFYFETTTAKAKKLLKYNDQENLKKDFIMKEFNTTKKMAEFIKKKYLKEVLETDLTSLKKTHSFFDNKISLDGLYVYRFTFDFFNSVNDFYEKK